MSDAPTIAPGASFGHSIVNSVSYELKLTIAFHPDVERIGESVILATRPDQGSYRGPFVISRNEPVFSDGEGLALPTLSRQGMLELSFAQGFVSFKSLKDNKALKIEGFDSLVQKQPRAVLRAGVTIHLIQGCVLFLREVEKTNLPTAESVDSFAWPGVSSEADRVRRLLAFVAKRQLPTLVVGASGVGKERAALAIHNAAGRPKSVYHVTDLPAVHDAHATETLFGAFSSDPDKAAALQGAFRRADNGTLVLKHLDRSGQAAQPLVLSGIDGRVQPVGDQQVAVNTQVIATSSVTLNDAPLLEPLKTRFQQIIVIPSLWSRREDIAFALKEGLTEEEMSDGEYPWDNTMKDERAAAFWARTFYRALTDSAFQQWPANYRSINQYVSGNLAAIEGIDRPLQSDDNTRDPRAGNTLTRLATLDSLNDERFFELAEEMQFNYRELSRQLQTSPGSVYRRVAAHPLLRTTEEIPTDEITAVLEANDMNFAKASKILRVSPRALKTAYTKSVKDK